MIKTLKLTNFRAVRDAEMNLEAGLVAIRGRNEGTKSTRLEAMMYALYGSRVLRNSLSDTVTYGLKDHQLKVEATFLFDNDEYRFVRHKGGAEVYVNGSADPYVTGQTEVTSFAARLVGADAATANKLMMASQGNLRGALEQGPKATAEMIEDLADFDLFDYLLDAMTKTLALGSAANLERTISELEESLGDYGQVDYDALVAEAEKNLSQKDAQVKAVESDLKEDEEVLRTLQSQVDEGEKIVQHVKGLENERLVLEAQSQANKEEYKQLALTASQDFDPSEITKLETELEEAQGNETTLKVYSRFTTLPKLELEWEGTLEGLKTHIATLAGAESRYASELRSLEDKVATLRSQIITQTVCPTCKQSIADAQKVEENNVKLRSEIEGIECDSLRDRLERTQEEHKELTTFLVSTASHYNFLESCGDYVEADNLFVPPRIKWKGEKPEKGRDVATIRSDISEKRKRQAAIDSAETAMALSERLVRKDEEQMRRLNQMIENTTRVNLSEVYEELSKQKTIVEERSTEIEILRKESLTIHTTMQNLKNRKEHEQHSKKQIEGQIERLTEQVKDLDFNNNLLKKVRQARPLVSDQLWNMVLSAVSTMFSKIRGVRSVVSKDKDGFKVNGEAVTGLSGSTLDILGASIRIALIRTFIPNCPFVVYDEPFAAMDTERLTAMLSFIQSTGFKQTIIVTHEEISEQVADQLITL